MNIKILDSWLRECLKTDATPQQLAEKLSLTSVSIEHMEPYKDDHVYDIEVTTNRPDLMSIVGLAREAAAILPQFGISAEFSAPETKPQLKKPKQKISLSIQNDPKLVHRLCAVVMEVTIKDSPQMIKDRLESSDIRSLNNVIDITNYVMRVIGHPCHVMDYDRLNTKSLRIRESKKGEKVTTLDGKHYTLPGWDIVAENDKGEIVDLLGVMGLENSVVTDQTKRILFFINTNDANRIRRTSMATAIRTEAATINEKDLDPELAYQALMYGIKLYQELADGYIISDIFDDYQNKQTVKQVTVSEQKINQTIGIKIPIEKSIQILQSLGFVVHTMQDVIASERNERSNPIHNKENVGTIIKVQVPSWRSKDIEIPEDIVEEVARVYGYHNIPNILPPVQNTEPTHIGQNDFYWEKRIKEAFKYWGFTETYTNSMISENMFQGPLENAVAIQNPLTQDMAYMRNTLIPSLLEVIKANKIRNEIKIFEIGNIYHQTTDLPSQTLHLSGVIKKSKVSFFEIKGLLEQVTTDLGISTLTFELAKDNQTVSVYIIANKKYYLGQMQLIDDDIIAFEINFETLLVHATLKKIYTPASKFPAIYEDISLVITPKYTTEEIIETIKKQNILIKEVSLLDRYKDTRTFHITYQSNEKNLTTEEVGEIHEKIISTVKTKYNAVQK